MTHNDRVLNLLSDGEWHSHHELYALHVIAHSRVSELRRRGYVIEIERDGDLYLYRLASGPTELTTATPVPTPSGEHGTVGPLTSCSDGEPCEARPLPQWTAPADTSAQETGVPSPSEQLTLEVAA